MVEEVLEVGSLLPKKFFVTKGKGEGDSELLAFDHALKDAGIQDCNLVFYSSILPHRAEELRKIPKLEFGSVLGVIMALAKGRKGERLTAGVGIGWIFDIRGQRLGGMVVEYHGNGSRSEARNFLRRNLEGMFEARFGQKTSYELKFGRVVIESFVPRRKPYGACLAAVCFPSFVLPSRRIKV